MYKKYFVGIPLIVFIILLAGSIAHAERNIAYPEGYQYAKYGDYFEGDSFDYTPHEPKRIFTIGVATWTITEKIHGDTEVELEIDNTYVYTETWSVCFIFDWC